MRAPLLEPSELRQQARKLQAKKKKKKQLDSLFIIIHEGKHFAPAKEAAVMSITIVLYTTVMA